ncbi:MAG: heme exporter protein CcmB [Armatimonadota bacterium]|nr:heme exporter protein CcmB [Armatimonadota bacterium]MDR5675054.1 heme exporter protein CcmB [Armatimonadota bacterium]MDR5688495.1 heme exporter protein CcmB [Armatimonadota bacterium]MDR7389595.1 heme exporter protein CcmB [Armatimonadota bacterium]MDR7390543.1 heme exporter protein CcmB [Armatimonadota bacterium]
MKAWRRVAAVARKDLLLEWRGRDAVLPAGSFGFAVLLVLGLVSGGGGEAAPSALWVSVLLAAVLAAGRGADREGEEGTREVLLLYPGSREDLFWGRWLALCVVLLVLAAGLWCAQVLLFDAPTRGAGVLILAALLATAGLGAAGTLLAALVAHVRAGPLLMPLLFLPATVPVLLAGVRLSETAASGAPAGPWWGVLVVFDLLFLLVGPVLFELVVEG